MATRVAIIIERADIALGGAERSMFEVAAALADQGLHVDLLAARGRTAAPNVHILCPDVPGKRVSLATFGASLRRHLAQTDYDIIHSVLPFDFADVYQPRGGTCAESIERHAASYPNVLVRHWKRMTAPMNRRRAELLRAERRLCRGSHGPFLAALSQYVADQFRQHYATTTERIALTLNGVTIGKHADPDSVADSRRRLLTRLGTEEAQEAVLLLFAAHNFRLKGLGPLVRAMQMAGAARTERPACLLVAGAGRCAPYRRLARRLGVERRILFLGPVESIRDILPAVDVGVLPTFYDPSSRFVLEALAAGKPVITTRFNGAKDHFTDGRHGKVVDSPDNVAGLADAIVHFTETINIERASRAIADDRLSAGISIHRVAQDLLGLYQSILTHKGRA